MLNRSVQRAVILWFWRLAPLGAILLGLLVAALAVILMGHSPVTATGVIIEGAFGNNFAIGATLIKSVPLLLTGLSVGVAFRAGLFNIGAEGQLQVGAAAAAATALALKGAPGPVALVAALLAAFAVGGVWGGIAGFLKATLKWNEIITTIMFNYVGLLLVNYLVNGPMLSPGENFPQSARIAAGAQLPMWIPGNRVHAGLFLAVALALLLHFLLNRSRWGFTLRIMGENQRVAAHAGLSVARSITLAMFVAGGLAGLAGAGEVLGVHYRLLDGFSPGFGYQGIAIAFLAGGAPAGMIPAALFFAAVTTGSSFLQRHLQVPGSIMYIVQALPVIFLAATDTIRRRQLANAAGEVTRRA